jgi:hypothetical protein
MQQMQADGVNRLSARASAWFTFFCCSCHWHVPFNLRCCGR